MFQMKIFVSYNLMNASCLVYEISKSFKEKQKKSNNKESKHQIQKQ